MRIIDRYITKSIISIFLATVIIFFLLYILIDMFSNLDKFIDRGVSFQILLRYYVSSIPIILIQTSSMACLIAVLLGYSHLNNNNEIIALRANGMSFWQITRPALCFGLIVAASIFLLNEKFVPDATMMSEQIKNEEFILEVDAKRKRYEKIKNLTFYGLKNRLFFIDNFDPRTYELNGITIIGQDKEQRVKEKIVAVSGNWTGIAWKFQGCTVSLFFEPDSESPESIKYYDTKLMDIKETPQDFLKRRLNVSAMNTKQLFNYINRFSGSGANKALSSLKVDMFQKIAFPFGNIVILLMGLPLCLSAGRRKAVTFTSVGIAIAIGFFYYVTNAVGLALGKGGMFPPFLSAGMAPIVFLTISLHLIRKKF